MQATRPRAEEDRLRAATALTDRFFEAHGTCYSLAWREDLPEHEFEFILDAEWHELVFIDRAAGHVLDLIGFFD